MMLANIDGYILICRPHSPSTQRLLAALAAAKINALHLPLLQYQYCRPKLKRIVVDLAVFTSAEAARGWQQAGGELQAGQIWALGSATSEQLAEYGLTATTPAIPTSEGLLEQLPADLSGQRIALIKGSGGRRLLASSLRRRAASVQTALCYRRLPCVIEQLPQPWPPQLAWLTSAEIARAMARLDTNLSVAVPSARVAAIARALGFVNIYNVNSAANAAFIQFIQSIWPQQKTSK